MPTAKQYTPNPAKLLRFTKRIIHVHANQPLAKAARVPMAYPPRPTSGFRQSRLFQHLFEGEQRGASDGDEGHQERKAGRLFEARRASMPRRWCFLIC